ncbi:MAG: B12-binding domain-containing radical SAM protein [Candidatus Scalindua sp.]|nr:B12-binding domain-containing radical SAM protein [Candidatus Scalindua sp.]
MSIVLLEHPRPRSPERYESVVNTPLSACLMTGYIASTLMSRHHEVAVVDANLYEWSFDKTVEELEKKSFKLLGVHLVYLWEYTSDILEALSTLKSNVPDIHINLYGHFPTFAFKDLLTEYPFIDSVTIGEPEGTFLELADAVVNNKGDSALSTIDGLAFNASNSVTDGTVVKDDIVRNRPRTPDSSLDNIPSPFRNDYELKKKKGISTYILASRGCYGKCTFCYLDNFYGDESQWRGRSPENIFNEMSDIYENHGERYFYFADANFFGPGRKGKERASELAGLIVDNGINIKFGIECRVNDVEEKTIAKLVDAGLADVFLGVESGSQRSLTKFRKFTTVEENKSAIYTLRKFGIEPNYGFIMFEPDSTLADVRANFEFLKEMKMLNLPSITAHLLHHKQTIFQGTFDYKIKSNGSKPDSEIMYECDYEFKEKAVAELSDDINTFCLQSLKEIFHERDIKNLDSDSCSYDESDLFSRQMNEKLIEHFETTLSLYEKDLVCT